MLAILSATCCDATKLNVWSPLGEQLDKGFGSRTSLIVKVEHTREKQLDGGLARLTSCHV
eukprot:2254914-Amphidinium_carterae.1